MAATVRINVKTEKAYSRIPSIIGKIKADTARMAYNFIRRAASLARSLAPVRTGFLKGSIITIKLTKGWRLLVGADYGAYVNYGTRNTPANPFFSQAVAIAKAEMRAA
jgi:hypothetical protein